MSRDPRATARACFALAARAGTEGEKAAALNRGMAIVERYKLDPDLFDIPGRERGPIPSRPFVRHFMTAAELDEIIEAAFGGMMGAAFRYSDFTVMRETATQKAEREREERMSRAVEEMAERRRRATDEAVMRAFTGDIE